MGENYSRRDRIQLFHGDEAVPVWQEGRNLQMSPDQLLASGRPIVHSVYYDDWKFPLVQTRQGALDQPAFDFTNVGYLMPQNNATHILYAADQSSHRMLTSIPLTPHVHWRQTQNLQPVFKLAYKIFDNGTTEPAAFTELTSTTNAFTYTSGNIAQITKFPAIDISTLNGISTILIIKFWRDDNVYTGNALCRSVDFHFAFTSPGTLNEYSR